MAKRRKNRKRMSRVDTIIAKSNDLRSALGFTLDRSFVESRRTLPQEERYISTTAPLPSRPVQREEQRHLAKKTTPSPLELYQAGFAAPDIQRATICAKRAARKEILHAFNKTGKVGQKKPRRSPNSDIHC